MHLESALATSPILSLALRLSAYSDREGKEAILDTSGIERLTEQEKRVLELLAVGRTTEELAAELAISVETARGHVQRILTKLGVHSRLEAAAFSMRTAQSEHAVRLATPDETPRLAEVLAVAFQDDPVTKSHFSPGADVIPTMRQFFEWVLEEMVAQRMVYTTADVASVAAWLPPDPESVGDEPKDEDPRAFLHELFGEYVGIVEEIISVQRQHHPTIPHFYLQFMGTLPDRRGRGIGSALLAPVLGRCDAEQVPAYLDASSDHSREFYLGRGFEVIGELPLSTGARFWHMRRLPR